MATVSSARSAAAFPTYSGGGAGQLCAAWGTYEIASALSAADIVEFCKVPKCDVIDGLLAGDDIDTGTEALEIDVGYSANGTDAADPDAFLNSGVITGDTITELKPVAGIYRPFMELLRSGPVALAATTTVIGTITAAANMGGTGTLNCYVYYLTA